MLGYAFIGDAYSRALLALRNLDVPLWPELVMSSGRTAEPLERVRRRWGVGRGDGRLEGAGRGQAG
jgi:hypothetical protein